MIRYSKWDTRIIINKYNPEYNIPHAPCPEVSWVEHHLLQMVLELEERVSALENVQPEKEG